MVYEITTTSSKLYQLNFSQFFASKLSTQNISLSMNILESDLPYLPYPIFLHHILPHLPIKSLLRFKCLNKQIFSTISDPDFKLLSQNRDRIVLLSQRKEDSDEDSAEEIHPEEDSEDEIHREKDSDEDSAEEIHLSEDEIHREEDSDEDSEDEIQYSVMNNKGHIEKYKTPPTKHRIWYPGFNFLGSSNGLILLSVKDEIFLWNPSILGSCRKVLELDRLRDDDYSVTSGFIYDRDKKDYKVIVLLTHSTPSYGGRMIFSASLKPKRWKRVSFPYNMDSAEDGPVVNNFLHWIVSGHEPMDDSDDDQWKSYWHTLHNTIIYFDSTSNGFKMLPVPDPIREDGDEIVGLLVIDECLCMMRHTAFDSDRSYGSSYEVEILVMKEYGVKESWSSTYIISDFVYNHRKMIALRMDLVMGRMHYDALWFMTDSEFFLCNPTTNRLEKIADLH